MPHISLPYLAIAALITSVAAVSGFMVGALPVGTQAEMRIEPSVGSLYVGDTFTLKVIVESNIPVNVFQGDIRFDNTVLDVSAIEYNTSIANLWAEEPWYSNGEGTLNFIGGTTKPGGFIGTGELLTIHFTAHTLGNTKIELHETNILQHDGLGTPVVLKQPIDALFTVSEETLAASRMNQNKNTTSNFYILNEYVSTDLNNDGTTSLVDVSIFMRYLATQNNKGDFSGDRIVDIKDLSILFNAL